MPPVPSYPASPGLETCETAGSCVQAGCTASGSLWLHRFVVFLVIATLVLIGIGGLVTSRGVGMAVPDWPNTYGYNMFAFPFSKWAGGILYEHSHRLMAAFVGLLTTGLTMWLWVRETRSAKRWLGLGAIALVVVLMGVRALPVYLLLAALAPVAAAFSLYQIRNRPGALRWWGVIAFSAVILQGVLGGLRVVWLKDQIGILHAALAQLFFVLVCVIAFFTSRWGRGSRVKAQGAAPKLQWWFAAGAVLILFQLILGATMRHQHAGLAIPDFPLAYGKLWPAMDAGSVEQYNQQRLETVALNPITAFQVGLQMTHRMVALLICAVVAGCAWSARRQLGASHPLSKLALIWLGIILTQGLLGAATIWSNKAADVATAHVLAGALALALGTILCIVCPRGVVLARDMAAAEALTPAPFGAQPSAANGLE